MTTPETSVLANVACARAIDNPTRATVDVSPLACRQKLFDCFGLLMRQSRPFVKSPEGAPLVQAQIDALAALYSLSRAVIAMLSATPDEHLAHLVNHMRIRFGEEQADAIFLAAPDLTFDPSCINTTLTPFLCQTTGLPRGPLVSPFRGRIELVQTVAEVCALTAFWVLPDDHETVRMRTGLLRETCLSLMGGGDRLTVLQRSPHCNLLDSVAPRPSEASDLNPPPREFAVPQPPR